MSQAVLTLIASHLLTFVESEIIKNEPAINAAVINDVRSLINKLELLLVKNANSKTVGTAQAANLGQTFEPVAPFKAFADSAKTST